MRLHSSGSSEEKCREDNKRRKMKNTREMKRRKIMILSKREEKGENGQREKK